MKRKCSNCVNYDEEMKNCYKGLLESVGCTHHRFLDSEFVMGEIKEISQFLNLLLD